MVKYFLTKVPRHFEWGKKINSTGTIGYPCKTDDFRSLPHTFNKNQLKMGHRL